MSLITCADCSKQISSAAAACPHCGAPIASGKPQSNPVMAGLVVGGIAGFGIGMAMVGSKTGGALIALMLAGLFAVVGALVGTALNKRK